MIHALILADLEGIINVYDLEDDYIRVLYTNEVQCCIDALIKYGVDKITVCDAHSEGDLIKPTVISENVKLISQVKNISFHEKYDFAVLLGFHGMEKSQGIFPHTFRSDFKLTSINDIPVGEVEIYSRWLGFHGVPVTLVIGDREATYEANCYNIYRNVCCVKSFFQEKHPNTKLLYEKIEFAIYQSLNLDKKSCLSSDFDRISIEFYNADVVKELGNYKKSNNKVIFKNCTELVTHLFCLIDELNDINSKIYTKNCSFLKEVRILAKGLKKEEIIASDIGQLLSKNLLMIDEKTRVEILTTLREIQEVK